MDATLLPSGRALLITSKILSAPFATSSLAALRPMSSAFSLVSIGFCSSTSTHSFSFTDTTVAVSFSSPSAHLLSTPMGALQPPFNSCSRLLSVRHSRRVSVCSIFCRACKILSSSARHSTSIALCPTAYRIPPLSTSRYCEMRPSQPMRSSLAAAMTMALIFRSSFSFLSLVEMFSRIFLNFKCGYFLAS